MIKDKNGVVIKAGDTIKLITGATHKIVIDKGELVIEGIKPLSYLAYQVEIIKK